MKSQRIFIKGNSHQALLQQLADKGVTAGAEVIYDKRNRLYSIWDEGERLCIKEFHEPHGLNKYIYGTLRHGKARRSFDNANEFLRLGIGTPRPVGYVTERKGLALRRSYYVCAFSEMRYMRGWSEFPYADEFIRALAAEMVRIMNLGILNRDFSPGNVLFERCADGSFRFAYVDLNRMEFGVKSRRRLMSMFMRIAPHYNETVRLAWQVALIAGVDPDKFTRDALRQLEKYLSRVRFKNAVRRMLGKPERF